jgi:hypothetical protein
MSPSMGLPPGARGPVPPNMMQQQQPNGQQQPPIGPGAMVPIGTHTPVRFSSTNMHGILCFHVAVQHADAAVQVL